MVPLKHHFIRLQCKRFMKHINWKYFLEKKKKRNDHTVQCNVVRVDLSFPINTFHKQIFKGTSIDIL